MQRLGPLLTSVSVGLALVGIGAPANAESRIGGGIHYWTAVGDIEVDDVDLDDSGTSYLLSYQYVPAGLFKFEADLEYFTDGFAGGENSGAFAPQVFALLGDGLYGGLGVGVSYNDDRPGDNWSDPFYVARVGLDVVVLPRIHLDINGNYQFDTFDNIDGADEDSITLGAAVRFAIN